MRIHSLCLGAFAAAFALAAPSPGVAQPSPQRQVDNSPLKRLEFISPKLLPSEPMVTVREASGTASSGVDEAWRRYLAAAPGNWGATVDARSGQIATVSGAGIPWFDGAGDLATLEQRAKELLKANRSLLGVEPEALKRNDGRSGRLAPHLWTIDFDVLAGGDPIEGARVVFRINNGRLIEFGSEFLPTPGTAVPVAKLDREAAREVVDRHLGAGTTVGGGFTGDDEFLDPGSLHLLPINLDSDDRGRFAPGKGRGLARVWQFTFRRKGTIGTWRARVDATTGDLLEFRDVNDYAAQATGGVAGDFVAGTETVRPLPFVDLGAGVFAGSAGLYTYGGTPLTSTLSGQLARAVDVCGAISLTTDGAGNLVFGSTASGTCATPGGGGAGNTRSSRTAYYSVSRGKEIARGWLPTVAWLNTALTANVNLSGTCNGFWNGSTLQLYRATAGSCGASGEEPGFILHEMGHGLDANDGGAGGGSTGESYADTNAAIVLHNSCVGAGFWLANCDGYGDACTSCTGLRDIDWARHTSNVPHTVANFTQLNCSGGGGPCGREVHCESYVPSEAVWDLANRDLPAPGTDSAWAVVERLFYSSRPTATAAFSCSTATPTWTSNGCNIGSMFRVLRAADDDDGDLTNGTPHGGAIFAALDRHGIACASDLGSSTTHTDCTPPPTPTLTVAGGSDAVSVSWTNSGAGIVYDLLRSETGCDAAFVHAATATTSTSFADGSGNVANGSVYSYEVVAYPSGNPACSSAPSPCLSTHLSGADPSIRPWGAALDPQTPPYWQTPDIWVDNQPNGIPNEAGEPSRGITNQLFARITNAGNADAGDYRVTFRAKPYTTSASAPAALIGEVDESGALIPGASRESQIAWDLSDAWVHANFDPMFWSATHFCVQVGIGATGVPLVDVDLTDNDAQNNFDNIPLSAGAGGVATAEFYLYNHLDRQAMASLIANPRETGWNVSFRGIADPARIPLGPHQWLPVTAIAVPSGDGRRPEKGRPVLIDVSQTIDGETVGGLTFAVQPHDFGGKGGNPPPASASSGFWLGVRTGGAWPLDPTRKRYTAGFHFGASLEREVKPHLRLGLEAGYDALAGRSGTSPLGITRLGLAARFLGGAGSWRPYLSAGVGAYRAAGSWKAGVALGLGLDLPISSVLGLTTGIEAHDVESTPAGDLRWIEAFVGLRARLP